MSFVEWFQNWFIDGIAWQIFWSILMTISATAIVRNGLGALKERRQALVFIGGIFIIAFGLLTVIGTVTKHRPRLTSEMLEFSAGSSNFPGFKCVLTTMVAITNTGNMASIAKNWRLTAYLNDKQISGQILQIPDTYTIKQPDSGQTITYGAQEALYNKALTPIPSGGMTTGILIFGFQNIDPEIFKAQLKSIKLDFQDALLNQYSITAPRSLENSPLAYIPGITEQKFLCPAPQ